MKSEIYGWILYYISSYALMLGGFLIVALLIHLFEPAHLKSRPWSEVWRSSGNLAIWALGLVLLSVTHTLWGFPKIINFYNSWAVLALRSTHLETAIPYAGSISESVRWMYFPVWVGFMLIAVDTLFYWSHRLLHHRIVYFRAHLAHHRFTEPTAFSAYSFHIFEGLTLTFTTYFLPLLVLPVSFTAALVYAMMAAGWAAFLHSNFDTSSWAKHPVLRYVYSPSHHRLHHRSGDHNFGLYFTYWDRAFETEKI